MTKSIGDRFEIFAEWLMVTYLLGLSFIFPSSEPIIYNFNFDPSIYYEHYLPNLEVETFRVMTSHSRHPFWGEVVPDLQTLTSSYEVLDESEKPPSPNISIPNPITNVKIIQKPIIEQTTPDLNNNEEPREVLNESNELPSPINRPPAPPKLILVQ